MSAQILLVDADAPELEHASTHVITTYESGEVLVRTDAPRPENAREGRAPHGLVLEGVDAATVDRVASGRHAEATTREPRLAYVELAGPVQPEWLDALRAQGVHPLRFQPHSAYLARATDTAFAQARELDFVVRVVPLAAELKTAPPMPEAGAEKAWIVVDASGDREEQASDRSDATDRPPSVERMVERLRGIDGLQPDGDASAAGGVGRVPVVLDEGALAEVLELPFVLSVEKRLPVSPEDEVAGLILAGSYDHRGHPTGDYRHWLDGHGIGGRGVTIGIVDNGVDETHEAFAGRITARDDGRAWHGTFVAGHAAGNYLAESDGDGFIYGLGTAPEAEIISQDNEDAAPDSCRETVTTGGPSGALGTIQNNSWGVGTHDPMDYRSLEASYDALVRDATPDDVTARPLTVCFSAGNSGGAGLTRPKAAKNVIVTGNSENYRPTVGGSESDNIDHLFTGSHGSSHGNCGDGRIRPDIVAPGEWTASANFDSSPGQSEYISPKLTWGGGTSGASPKTAGACALLTEWWRERNAGLTPSPALLRALLVNGAEDTGFGGPVPNARQGWGRLNLANVLSAHVHHVYVDQSAVLRHRGEARTWRLRVTDPDLPVRVTLAWTDPPGPLNSGTASVPAIVNSLTLSLRTEDRVYHANHFTNGFSVEGPLPEPERAGRDNLQNVFVARGETRSPFTVEVRALDITTDCLSGEAIDPRQDFALVVTNGHVDTGSVPLDLFMLVDDTSPGAGSSIDDVVVGGGGGTGGTSTARPTLRRGERGEHVRHLQTLLHGSGFLSGSVDGVFGFGTQANVKSFQRSVGLAADGVVGPATWAALEAAGGSSGGAVEPGGTPGGTPGDDADDPPPDGPGTGGTDTTNPRPTLRFGARGDDVRHLQTLLRDAGHLGGTIDGLYGNGTLRAVKAFQRAAGLTADGITGTVTWEALETAVGGANPGDGSDEPFDPGTGDDDSSPPPPSRPTLRFGARGEDVRLVQERLSASGFLSGSIDGIYGNGTLRAVKAFQRSAGLGADGIVGTATWAALLAEAPRARARAETAPAPSLLAAAERVLRCAPAPARVSALPMPETTVGDGAADLSEALDGALARLERCLADHVCAAALVVVGARTRVDAGGLRALRRLALHGGLYLVGTDAEVLHTIVQGLHLERGVHPRLARPATLEAGVRAVAAEASGLQELVLRRRDDTDHGVRTLSLDFELSGEDSRAVVEISGVDDAAEISVVPPGGHAAYRLTRSSRRKGAKLVLAPGLASVELAVTEHKPWSGSWSLRVEGRGDGGALEARGFAGRGPALVTRCKPVTGDGSTLMVSVRAEDGGTLERLRAIPADPGTLFEESGERHVERVARSSRLATLGGEHQSGDRVAEGGAVALDLTVRIGEPSDRPTMLELRLEIVGRTARGEPFSRRLQVAPYHLVPRDTWRHRYPERDDTRRFGSGEGGSVTSGTGRPRAEAVRTVSAGAAVSLAPSAALVRANTFVRPAPGAPVRLAGALASAKPTRFELAQPITLSAAIKPRLHPALADLRVVSKLPILKLPVLPAPSPSSPVRVDDYLLWPDPGTRTVWFMLATPERAEFSLVVEQDSDFRITGASATLVTSLFPAALPDKVREGWAKTLQRTHTPFGPSWRFQPLALNRLDATLELPEGHARGAPSVTTNPRLGTATLLVELSALGAQVWRQSLDGGAAPPGVCRLNGWYVGGRAAKLAARSQSSSATLASLLRGVSPETVRTVDPEIAVDATLRVDGDPTIESMTVELRASNGTVRTETFAAEGGEMTMRMLVEDPSAARIDWQVRVVFAAAAWPPMRVGGVLSNETGWSELLAPSSWLRSVSLTTMLIGADGDVLTGEASDSTDQVSGAIDFSAPFLEGATSLHTAFETSSRASTAVLVPRPPSEPPGEIKLTVFALRGGRDAMEVRTLAPDEEWVLVKIYANARIEIVTNRTPSVESERDPNGVSAVIRTLEALHRR